MYPLYRDLARIRGPERHDAIRDNLRCELTEQIGIEQGGLLSKAARVKAPTGLLFHPDICIYCDRVEGQVFDDDALVNPGVLMEVLESGADVYDRSETFRHYRSLPSLVEYWLIESEYPTIERFSRTSPRDPWVLSEYHSPDATIWLSPLKCSVRMAFLYKDVEFDYPLGPRHP